ATSRSFGELGNRVDPESRENVSKAPDSSRRLRPGGEGSTLLHPSVEQSCSLVAMAPDLGASLADPSKVLLFRDRHLVFRAVIVNRE
ncbi:hypothetical protein SB717_36350, partial [Priestia sp. SIMBA_032]|uniref:hypothetical protein n=1 Tax=Priestia sp. SIMBA_032 TaxID=3085775 RepID=UPI00397CF6F5